ncbi:hypothetical protein EBB79_08510 [Parasedimentitalea marina]|uniref:Uncharacterized protein n=1 Tax=Parasedimentitalea marina TaxID=2483033 RepID=A0A3T0N1N4_9RHOB|nr:hypothetical protein [Parasedimentitalea marina]AZV77933.1 hypothetical protein EBB79_08510 [Parasedimentitalea marina]
MFNVVTVPTFSRTVKVKVPDGDGHLEQSFKGLFKVVPSDQSEGLDWFETEGVKEFLREVMISADDLVDDKEKPIPYSEEIREGLLNLPYVRMALLKTYTTALIQDALGN